MKLGLCTFPTAHGLLPAELAVLAEDAGFESLWFAEHSHIPVSRLSPWPGGDELPEFYSRVLDPVSAMAAAAAVTDRIRLGFGIALVAQRDPIQFAKSVASLDVMSSGRVAVGVGGGWNAEEMANHGTDIADRWQVLRERIEAVKAIWTTDEAEYHGKFVDFDPIFSWPKPVQDPHPPLHFGGRIPGGLRRALRHGQGWIPLLGRGDSDFAAHMDTVRTQAHELGRDLSQFEVTVYGCGPDLGTLESYRDAGIHRALLFVPPMSASQARAAVEVYQRLLDHFR
ncbi:LLM class F420-dependent oxidoreductase [Mycobacterium sp.]|uniref:LLM class F420-dependent oxidoreductase n=1 Tax=Mycobacterium sp. TaxID=1785 RepID=UPI000CBAA4C5|nr:LLM class F420-dependent oxidoreductase [Mycobacterium sp.]PJE05344.1 MAG: LLM class F420-dependent oxidoreductase [Mycobacterium sp.]